MNKTGKFISIAAVLAILISVFVIPASAALLGKDGFYYEFENNNAILKEYHSSSEKEEIVIPSDIYSHDVVAIAAYTFLRNTDITSVTIPDTVTKIGNSAFYGCANLRTVTIPASVTVMGNNIFANCENLTILCYSGSEAEAYAKNNKIPYKLIDGVDPDDPGTDPDKKTFKYGDVNQDGSIDSVDSLLILRRSVSLESFTNEQETLADVDFDGKITSADALDVLRYSVKLSVPSRVGEEAVM